MDYWLSFVTGLAGSLHCVGMCGSIVLAYSAQRAKGNGKPKSNLLLDNLLPHLTYNSGRILSYAVVGGLFGTVGAGLHMLQGVGVWFSFASGMVMIILGIGLLRIVPWFQMLSELRFGQETRNLLFKVYRASFGALVASPGLESKFSIGFLTPLLPCGLLYSMFVKAASTGSLLGGAGTMFFFGLGIVPALVVTGMASSYFSQHLRAWGDKVAALAVLLMGLMLVARAMGSGNHLH
ncbi:MAG TPA: sulfite exporter TauE/SafE family protein [Bacteroidota bacterium]|nr:sulfite exporter TauE/SafE family protein [Bacteroidota bacterium]